MGNILSNTNGEESLPTKTSAEVLHPLSRFDVGSTSSLYEHWKNSQGGSKAQATHDLKALADDKFWFVNVILKPKGAVTISKASRKSGDGYSRYIINVPLITENNYHNYQWGNKVTKNEIREVLTRLGFRREENNLVMHISQRAISAYFEYTSQQVNPEDNSSFEEILQLTLKKSKRSIEDHIQTYGAKEGDCRIM